MAHLWRRLRMLFGGARFDRELDEEMRLHLELRAEEAAARGLPPDEAQAAARRRFGNPTALRERSRDAWGWRWLDDLARDLRYGLRALRRGPGFAFVVVLTLALGIGANTAILSVVDAVLLRPLPYAAPDRLVVLLHDGHNPVAPANFLDWRAQAASFQQMAAAEYWTPNLAGVDRPEQVDALRLTADMWPLLGVAPALGRTFTADETRPGAPPVVVLTWQGWQRRFAGSPDVLGRSVELDGVRHTIVGVMPRDFQFAPFWVTRAELFAPLSLAERANRRKGNSLRVFARLRDGTTLAQARGEIARITARLEQSFPGTNGGVQVVPLTDKVVGDLRPALLVLLGAAAFVLLACCANIAHMLLARAQARRREVLLRVALGATRGRIVRQFLAESLLLTIGGGLGGIALGGWGIDLLLALHPSDLPPIAHIAVDHTVLGVMIGVSLAAGIGFGLVPALHATSGDVHGGLKDGGRATTDGAARGTLRGLFVVTQLALALPLLVGAGLMIRSFVHLMSIDPGFRSDGVVALEVSVTATPEAAPGRRADFYRELVQRTAALPDVRAASAINHLPLAGDEWGLELEVEGRPPPPPDRAEVATFRAVLPGYFDTLRVPLLRGRDVAATDTLDTLPVVVVNARLAERIWPGEDPIGKCIGGTFFDGQRRWLTVVGVVADVRQGKWERRPRAEIYLPVRQVHQYLEDPSSHFSYLTIVARGDGDRGALLTSIRGLVRELSPNATVSGATTMSDVVDEATAQPRFYVVLLAVFAALALVLAAVGIYGVMSYTVSRRTHEIGVRMALGAQPREVLRLVVGRAMVHTAIGAAVGLAASLALGRLMSSLLFGVSAADPLTLGAVTVLLALVAALAAIIPARRASRIAPTEALRTD